MEPNQINLENKIKVKAWFAIIANDANHTSLALETKEGRRATRMWSAVLHFLSLPESTSDEEFQQEFKKLKENEIPLSLVATKLIHCNQIWKLFKLKKEINKSWNNWEKENLWPSSFKWSPEFPKEMDVLVNEKKYNSSNPLVVFDLLSNTSCIKKILKEDFDPTLPLIKCKKNELHRNQFALGTCLNCLNYKSHYATTRAILEDGRVNSHSLSLLHALIFLSENSCSESKDVFFKQIINQVNEDDLFEKYKISFSSDDKGSEHTVLFVMLEHLAIKFNHRWKYLKNLDFSKMPESEMQLIIQNQIKNFYSFNHFKYLNFSMLNHFFNILNPGENPLFLMLNQLTELRVDGGQGVLSFLKNFRSEFKKFTPLSLSEITILLKNSNPMIQHDKVVENKDSKKDIWDSLSRFHLNSFIILNEKNFLLNFVKEKDREACQKLFDKIQAFEKEQSNLKEKLQKINDYLTLNTNIEMRNLSQVKIKRI